jgi:hypothetical protein
MTGDRTPSLKVADVRGKLRELPLYDSSKPRERTAVVYMVKTLPDGIRLAYNRDYKLVGSVQATTGRWEAALIHSLDTWPGYSVNDQMDGDAVWFEVSGAAREPYRRSWIEQREWEEEGENCERAAPASRVPGEREIGRAEGTGGASMYVLLAELKVQPDKVEDFGRLIDQQAKDSLERERDCHQFDVCQHETDPHVFLL